LSTLRQGTALTYTYSYNGLGDRQSAFVMCTGGVCIPGAGAYYVLDLNAGLTQVLAEDGVEASSYTYLYGNGRIAQYGGTTTSYLLGDALGSVRQLTNSAGQVTLARSYQPYGNVLSSAGTGLSNYGFAGEFTDASGLIHLRARYMDLDRTLYHSGFVGRLPRPLTLNKWSYVLGNPNIQIQGQPTGLLSTLWNYPDGG
jgi:RHS repeat-associated protein